MNVHTILMQKGFSKIFWLCLCVSLLAVSESCQAQSTTPLKVRLDSETFPPLALKALQPIADRIAEMIDEMIPGPPLDYPQGGLDAFIAPPFWNSPDWIAKGFSPPPVTFSGAKALGEPKQTKAGTVRIAMILNEKPIEWQFAFQLSHELAHVKMGVRTDNYLDETFATAVSFEVLRRLGYFGYLLTVEGSYVEQLAPAIQTALATGDWTTVQRYWRNTAMTEGKTLNNRAFQIVGALLLLRDRGVRWSSLYMLWKYNDCSAQTPANRFDICSPDLRSMQSIKVELEKLGFQGYDLSKK